jgi:predicted nucleic acid-binding protein
MSYLLDAETCAAILRRSDATVLERLGRVAVNSVAISAVTLAVLQYGVEASRRSAQERKAVELLLRHVAVHDFPGEAAKEYGVVRMVLAICEVSLPEEVMLAAAHARHQGWTLVTPHAGAVARVNGVMTERWGG